MEGVGGEGGVAAVVSHSPSEDAAADAASAAGAFDAARNELGPRRELGGVVHTGATLWRVEEMRKKKRGEEMEKVGEKSPRIQKNGRGEKKRRSWLIMSKNRKCLLSLW